MYLPALSSVRCNPSECRTHRPSVHAELDGRCPQAPPCSATALVFSVSQPAREQLHSASAVAPCYSLRTCLLSRTVFIQLPAPGTIRPVSPSPCPPRTTRCSASLNTATRPLSTPPTAVSLFSGIPTRARLSTARQWRHTSSESWLPTSVWETANRGDYTMPRWSTRTTHQVPQRVIEGSSSRRASDSDNSRSVNSKRQRRANAISACLSGLRGTTGHGRIALATTRGRGRSTHLSSACGVTRAGLAASRERTTARTSETAPSLCACSVWSGSGAEMGRCLRLAYHGEIINGRIL